MRKKMLLLGNSCASKDIVKLAHKIGAYVIAVDNTDNQELKQLADKCYSVDTADLDKLEKIAKIEDISCVIAGVSEFNIQQALTLSKRLGTLFYTTQEQWDMLSNKVKFKDLCRNYNVPVVKEYDINKIIDNCDDDVVYPLIIKPVDSSGGRGISICNNRSELLVGYKKALEYSKSKKIILERYMTGNEVTLYYTIQDGYISLSAMCDRYVVKQDGVSPLTCASIFPSKYLKRIIEFDNYNIIKMFRSVELKNGVMFMQAFVENGEVKFYEMGFRNSGSEVHNIISEVNGINPLEMLVRFSLTGKMDGWDLKVYDNAEFKKYACILTPILGLGIVNKIEGLEEIEKIPGVTKVICHYKEGDAVNEIGTLKQLLGKIYLVANSVEVLKERIDIIQSMLKVYDKDGKDMLISKFDTDSLLRDYIRIDVC